MGNQDFALLTGVTGNTQVTTVPRGELRLKSKVDPIR